MSDQFAVIVADVPSATGTADYTDPAITSWTSAIIFWSGNYLDEGESANLGMAFVNAAGESVLIASDGRPVMAQTDNRKCGHSANVVRVLDSSDASPGVGSWALANFDSALSNGVRLNWTDISGVSAGVREFKLIIVLFGGQANTKVSSANLGNPYGFEADTHISAGGVVISAEPAVANGFSLGLGAAVNSGGIPQACAHVMWPRLADPVAAGAVARNDAYVASHSNTLVESHDAVTAYSGTGFTQGSTADKGWLAIEWSDSRQTSVALETLDGGTGPKSLTGLGISSKVLIGMVTAVTAGNTPQTGATAEVVGLFVTDGVNTYSVSASIDEGHDPDASVVPVFTRYADGEINLVDAAGGTAFRATAVRITQEGLEFDVQTGMSGRMVLWGVQRRSSYPFRELAVQRVEALRRLRWKAAATFGRRAAGLVPNLWREFARQRVAALRRLRWRAPAITYPDSTPTEVVLEPPEGQNALAGSERGASAIAGSAEGMDSAT